MIASCVLLLFAPGTRWNVISLNYTKQNLYANYHWQVLGRHGNTVKKKKVYRSWLLSAETQLIDQILNFLGQTHRKERYKNIKK